MPVYNNAGKRTEIMKKKIVEIAKQNKITEIGFCRIKDYYAVSLSHGADKGVFSKNTPFNFNAKTAIVFAFNYYVNRPSGNISRYAWGKDYHLVAKDKMKPVVELLRKEGFVAESFVDVGSLNERMLAKLSGIAFIGKNSMAINGKFGSYFFLGYILTDCELEPDSENTDSCMNCGKCIRSCPLGAIGEDGFKSELCMSYISQKKGELSDAESDALEKTGKIWGCDICQEVCPHNTEIPETEIDEFKNDIITNLCIGEMSNKEFKKKFGDRAFAWRGKSVILRNQKSIYDRKQKNLE